MSVYDIRRNERGHIGLAVLLNNSKFKSFSERHGSDVDVRNVRKSLERAKFEVMNPYEERTAEQIVELVNEYATKCDFSTYSCFAFIIMSHGGANSQIYGVDDRPVSLVNSIVEPFQYCRTLHGKPKLFFVNACRIDDDIR
jgi:hypothetical protein